MSLLELRDVSVRLPAERGGTELVHSIDLTLAAGEMLCLVGESGSGKTVTGDAVLGLSSGTGLEVTGSIRFDGQELVDVGESVVRGLRGRRMTLVPQDPMGSLDPVFTIGHQLVEAVRRARGCGRREARGIALDLLRQVRVPDPEIRLRQYPQELSGGLCQRILIAMALAGPPELIFADEPTSALDVTVQAQVLALLEEVRAAGTAVLCVTHDMGVGALADRVAVMYAGTLVEVGPAGEVLRAPRHPYTAGLISSVPRIDGPSTRHTRMPAMPAAGTADSPGQGCVFAARCPAVQQHCRDEVPPAADFGDGHWASCWRSDELAGPDGGIEVWSVEHSA
jgi:oligopeptide/dipeptide ABC transporter ATP-binding protein